MKKYPFRTRFTSIVQASTPEDVDAYLSKASLKNLKGLIPDNINYDDNIDLIPNAFNACVINRINNNDDGISTETALAIYKNFSYKPCNIEHKRSTVVGSIISAGFSEFGTNQLLSEEDIKDSEDPFNLCLSSLVYRVVNEKFANLLVEASDPTSDKYQFVCASWELAFHTHHILLGSKNFNEGELVTDPEKVKELSKFLRAKGGSGVTDKGENVYRVPYGDVLPLGIGYTSNPAADVKGVFVGLIEDEEEEEIKTSNDINVISDLQDESGYTLIQSAGTTLNTEKIDIKQKTSANIDKTISQSIKTNVKQGEIKDMKIKSLDELKTNWDEIRASDSAKSVHSFFESELEKASEAWSQQLKAKETEVSDTKKIADEAKAEIETLKEDLKKTNTSLEAIQSAQAAKEADEAFNSRMSALDDEFELEKDDREIIASQIQDLDLEQFNKWKKSFDVLAKEKNKVNKAKKLEEIKASLGNSGSDGQDKDKDQTAIDQAFANAQKPNSDLPNSSTENTLLGKDRWMNALKEEKIEITQ